MLDGYITIDICPNCKQPDPIPFGKFYAPPVFQGEMNNIKFLMFCQTTYYMCDKCGLYIQTPRLTDENLNKFYADGVYAATLGYNEEIILQMEKERANQLVEYLAGQNVDFKTHTDYGAAHGYFLDATKEQFGAESYGYDLYGKFAGNEMRGAELVSCVHVLEHVSDPLALLQELKQYTQKYLLIVVPRNNYSAYRLAHLYVFPLDTLKNMIRKQGFKILHAESTQDTRVLVEVASG